MSTKEDNYSNNSNDSNLERDFSQITLFSLSSSSTSYGEKCMSLGYADSSLENMYKFFIDGKLCDIVLVAGTSGKRIPAHRLVLSAASDYFAVMFVGNLRESQEKEVVLNNIDADILQDIIVYCYLGTIEIKEENVESLLEASCLMQLTQITQACERFLINQLHPSNCLGIAAFADHQNCLNLLKKAESYVINHFSQVAREKEFLKLPIQKVSKLLSNNEINVSSEEQVFSALKNWINHDFENRKQHISSLLALIKLPLLQPAFIMDHVESWINHDTACQKLLMEAIKWHLLPARRNDMESDRTIPRKATLKKLIVVGGTDRNASAITVETYDPKTNTWTITHNVKGPRWQFGVAYMDDKLILVGGRDGLLTLNAMECLDLDTKKWTSLGAMNSHRHGLAVAELDGSLYAMGGHDCWHYLNSVERYSPTTKTWQFLAAMHYQRCSAGVAVLNGKIYMVGGRDGSTSLNSAEYYDAVTNTWIECAPMKFRRAFVGLAAVNGCLYAIGGRDVHFPSPNCTNTVECYDPNSNSWSLVASLSAPRDSVAACAFGEYIVAAGGHDGNRYLNIVEQYDPITNCWTSLNPLNIPRAGVCILQIPDKEAVISGGEKNDLN